MTGLSKKEAASRLEQFGPNEIKELNRIRWYHVLLNQFLNIMMLILAVAVVVSFFAGDKIDALAILAIIFINAIIGFIQEYKAERAVQALKKMTPNYAFVIRDDNKIKIHAREIVPGDILLLEEGMHIPADGRLIEVNEMQTIESSLTGESLPVEKSTEENKNLIFMGTSVCKGHGIAIVTSTGMETEFGQLAKLVQTQKDDPTPLQKQLNQLTRALAILVVCIIAMLFALSLIMGRDPLEMFLMSVSLAVSVIPEGLPAVITLTLALGVQRIAKKNAIIRKLSAAETLGSTSIICTDKTGTLTQNEMTVKAIYVNEEILLIPGVGYEPDEKFDVADKELELLLSAGALCNNATLIPGKKRWTILGDPTEAALLTLAHKGGITPEKLAKKWQRLREWVFTSERKYMSTQNGPHIFTKGALDSVLENCSHIQIHGKILKLTSGLRTKIIKENDTFAEDAYRVLAFAYKTPKNKSEQNEKNMIFLGLTAMADPARPEAKTAIELCHKAHIRVVMITGDHALTAMAIGKEIGLYKKGDRILTGPELEKISMKKLISIVEEISIFARVNPSHKVKILMALKAGGGVVSMTGDGVNDAPALKGADIGVAMGITGTDVSKEASEMILIDDNFATIISTVEEGRVIYRNIKKFIRFLLSANFDEVILITVVFLLGYPLPFIPLQILWINLLTDALPAIALGMDTPEKDIMNLKPRNPKQSIFKELLSFSLVAGVVSSIMLILIYFNIIGDYSIEKTRTIIFSTIVIFELSLAFSVRFEKEHFFTSFFSNKLLLASIALSLGLQILAVYNPVLQNVLKTEALSLNEWLAMIGVAACGIIVIEFWKLFRTKSTHV